MIGKKQICEQFDSELEPTCEHKECYQNWYRKYINSTGDNFGEDWLPEDDEDNDYEY